MYTYICIYIPVNPLTGVETNGLTNFILPGLILCKAARFPATSCMWLLVDPADCNPTILHTASYCTADCMIQPTLYHLKGMPLVRHR